jgi:hypothetical protein
MSGNGTRRRAFSPLQLIVVTFGLTCIAGQAYSQVEANTLNQPAQAASPESDQDLLKAVQNPVADLISIPVQNNTNFGLGQYSRTQNGVSLQPVIPWNMSTNWMLVGRIIQPMVWQPHPDQKSGGQFGLGDMNPSIFLAPRNPGSVIWGVGPAMVVPTATCNLCGQGKFSLGPSAVVLAQPGQWTLGALVSNVWSVAGSGSRPPVNRMSLQYFMVYNLKHDWYVTAAPVILADWRESAGNRWLVPVGGGVGKLVTFGSRPVDFAGTFYGNAVTPAGGPKWQMSLQMTLLFPKGK